MPSFKDANDREWAVSLDAPTIERIREDCYPAFLKGEEGAEKTFTALDDDPVLLCRVIYLICKAQTESRQVSEESFYLAVIGDAIDAASEALVKAILSFIPRRRRELSEVTAAKNTKLRELVTLKAIEKINQPDLVERIVAGIDEKMDAAINEMLMSLTSATSTPDSVGSDPKG